MVLHEPAAVKGKTSGSAFRCPSCHHPESRCLDSRPVGEGDVIRRRRICCAAACRHRWTTFEMAFPDDMKPAAIGPLMGRVVQLSTTIRSAARMLADSVGESDA